MNIKKAVFFCTIIFSFLMYSSGPFFDKNDKSEMFEYKPLMGFRESYSYKEVEELMTLPLLMIQGVAAIVPCVFLLKCKSLSSTKKIVGFVGVLGMNALSGWEIVRFQAAAKKWLQELKEKELSSKNEHQQGAHNEC